MVIEEKATETPSFIVRTLVSFVLSKTHSMAEDKLSKTKKKNKKQKKHGTLLACTCMIVMYVFYIALDLDYQMCHVLQR